MICIPTKAHPLFCKGHLIKEIHPRQALRLSLALQDTGVGLSYSITSLWEALVWGFGDCFGTGTFRQVNSEGTECVNNQHRFIYNMPHSWRCWSWCMCSLFMRRKATSCVWMRARIVTSKAWHGTGTGWGLPKNPVAQVLCARHIVNRIISYQKSLGISSCPWVSRQKKVKTTMFGFSVLNISPGKRIQMLIGLRRRQFYSARVVEANILDFTATETGVLAIMSQTLCQGRYRDLGETWARFW